MNNEPGSGVNLAARAAAMNAADLAEADFTPGEAPDKTDALRVLKERIAKAKARREKVAAETDVKSLSTEAEVEELIADLEEKHGPRAIRRVDTVNGPVVLRRGPDSPFKKFKRYLEKLGNKATDEAEVMLFVQPAVQFPKDFNTFLDDTPGALDTLALELMKLHGFKPAEDAEKR